MKNLVLIVAATEDDALARFGELKAAHPLAKFVRKDVEKFRYTLAMPADGDQGSFIKEKAAQRFMCLVEYDA